MSTFDTQIFAGVVALLSGWCWHEYLCFKSIPATSTQWAIHWSRVLLGALPALLLLLGYDPIFGIAAIMLSMQIRVINDLSLTHKWERSFENLKNDLVGFLYITGLFTCMLFSQIKGGPQAVIFLFVVVGVADSGAYFGGRFFGKTPFFDLISPKKTKEGFWSGLICAGIFAEALAFFFKQFDNPAPNLFLAAVLGMGVAFASVFGDLFESAMKRHFGVKDSGRFLPGHGGALDRFDGVLFGALPLFFYIVLFGGFK